MNYTNRFIHIKVTFNDIYYWGAGWKDGETKVSWDKYLANLNKIFWRYFSDDSISHTDYLVGTNGSVFLHPMGFETNIGIIGKSSIYDYKTKTHNETFTNIEELIKICNGLANACDGSITIDYINLVEYTNDGNCKVIDIKESYVKSDD